MRIAQVAPLYESVPPKLYGRTERIFSYDFIETRYNRKGPSDRTDDKYFSETIMGTILLIVLILLLIGALPTWPYSAGWGYYPTGGLGLVLLIVLVLVLFRLI